MGSKGGGRGWARARRFAGLLSLLAAALPVGAAAQEAEPLAPALSAAAGVALPEIHGFVSQGYIRSLSNNWLTASDSSRGSFEMSEMGLNFTQTLSENLRAGIQLFSRDLGPLGNYSIKADWYYLDFRWADWLGARAGRTRLPFGLYNETNDIDSARVPILDRARFSSVLREISAANFSSSVASAPSMAARSASEKAMEITFWVMRYQSVPA